MQEFGKLSPGEYVCGGPQETLSDHNYILVSHLATTTNTKGSPLLLCSSDASLGIS